MTETMTPATTAVTELANRPLTLDEYPVQDGDLTVNMWVRQADQLATMRVTREDEDDDGEAVTTEIDVCLDNNDLFRLGLASGDALAALGRRDDLAELIKSLTDTLCKMR